MNTDTGFYQELTSPYETLREGDEFLDATDKWCPIDHGIGRARHLLANRVRRPIAAPEYRMLGARDILKPGDQVYREDGGWVNTQLAGCLAGAFLRYRRPVTQPTMVEPDPAVRTYVVPDASTNPTDPKGSAAATRCPLHLLPVAIMEETAWVLKGGAEKYGIRNYRHNKVCASTYISAIMRHLNKWREREDLDTESGRSHLAHIAANCAILMDAAQHGTLEDDRA